MERILDRLLPHDDSIGERTPGSRLETSSILAHKLWLERHGMPYVQAGAMYRGDPPAPVPIPPPRRNGHLIPTSFWKFIQICSNRLPPSDAGYFNHYQI
ncbi:hypothetical protein GOP47_0021654 [Adiantum capillus-veneris]|uniref:Uncharacterized protein n=1 Tax=Adiantum capillus-veneris TaxID=13818 RepID=A0A9D4U880_ADICA|nr:hypothetical protein GOP47_0021654 [Adiantum capillus-veneris]